MVHQTGWNRFYLCIIVIIAILHQPCNGSSASAISSASTTLKVSCSLSAFELLGQAIRSYKLQQPDISILLTSTGTSTQMQKLLLQGQSDFVVVNQQAALTAQQRLQYPDLLQMPLFTQQVSISYSNDVADVSSPLVFSIPVLARIFSANITWWNDTEITNLNPGRKLPEHPIQVVMGDRYSLAGQDTLCDVFSRVDSEFQSRFPCSSVAFKPPLEKYGVPPLLEALVSDVVATAAIIPYTISIGSAYEIASNGRRQADVINQSGARLSPSVLSASLPSLEVGFPLVNGVADISLAQGPQIYPFVQYLYLQVSKSFIRATCATHFETLQFLLWFYQSPVMRTISRTQFSPILDDPIQNALGIIDQLKSQMVCLEDVPLLPPSTTQNGRIFGFKEIQQVIQPIMNLYNLLFPNVERTYDFTVAATELQSFSLINHDSTLSAIDEGGEAIDAALVISSSADNRADRTLHHSLPFATTGLTLLYNPPLGLSLTQTGPIILDLETVAQVFLGQITSWTHPRIRRLNPGLFAALTENPTIPTNITVVLCCGTQRGTPQALSMLRTILAATDAFQSSSLATSATIDWSLVFALSSTKRRGLRFIMSDNPLKVPTTVLLTPGSIGYGMMDYPAADDALHIRLLPWHGSSTAGEKVIEGGLDQDGFYAPALNQSIKAEPARTAACVTSLSSASASIGTGAGGMYDPLAGWVDLSRSSIPADCWPMTQAVELLLPWQYTSDSKDISRQNAQGLETLNLVKFLITSPPLSSAFTSRGFARLSDSLAVQSYLLDQLNVITCDGESCLLELPIPWDLTPAIETFTNAWSGIFISLGILGMIIIWLNRRLQSIHASGIMLLSVISLGFILMQLSAILWMIVPFTLSSCQAFHWNLQLGFTLAFLPIVLKVYRLSRILDPTARSSGSGSSKSQKSAKSKLTDFKMLLLVLAALVIDCILTSLSSSGHSTDFTLHDSFTQEHNDTIQYTHCTPGSKALPFLGTQLGLKAAWILWGTLQTFSLAAKGEHISPSLNQWSTEVKQVSYALYNVLFSSFIILPITILLELLGDALMLLIMILIIWTATVGWCTVFLPKLYAEVMLARSKASLLHAVSHGSDYLSHGKSGANGTGGPAFSFIALSALSRDSLGKYILALDHVIISAKQRLALLGGSHLHKGVEYRAPLLTDDHSEEPSANHHHESSRSHSTHPARAPGFRVGSGGQIIHRQSPTTLNNHVHARSPTSHQRGGSGGGGASQVREASIRLSSVTNNFIANGRESPASKPLSRPGSARVHAASAATMALAAASTAALTTATLAVSSIPSAHRPPTSPQGASFTRSMRPTSSGNGNNAHSHPTSPTSPNSQQGIVNISRIPSGATPFMAPRHRLQMHRAHDPPNGLSAPPAVVVTFHGAGSPGRSPVFESSVSPAPPSPLLPWRRSSGSMPHLDLKPASRNPSPKNSPSAQRRSINHTGVEPVKAEPS